MLYALNTMRIRLIHKHLLSSPKDLEQALSDRVPQKLRGSFFAPPFPSQLTEEDHGINSAALATAAARVREAIEKQEKVVIFGDYDCDGVTATAILWETLRHAGIVAHPFLPHREKHGYGLSVHALQDVFEQGKPDLLITVDNGIVANEAFAWLKEHGVSTILTDHHAPSGELPPADIIVHSTKLCGATVSWMLANAIDPEFAVKELDLAVLGTIADQVPLIGANRSFAIHGLNALRTTTRPSLLALAKAAGVDLKKATTHSIHYGLAPRINAMGRLYHALDALRALVSRNADRISELAQQLQDVNQERQAVTHEAFEELQREVTRFENDPFIIVAGPYHEGVIGLLASKLVETTGKPSIVLSNLGEVAKASCRSLDGVNITEFLRSVKDVTFLSLGGHAHAAGFSLKNEDLESRLEVLRKAARQRFTKEDFVLVHDVLGELAEPLLRASVLASLERFSPYGAGNEEPLFLLRNIQILSSEPLGKSGAHRRLKFYPADADQPKQAVVFQAHKRLPEQLPERLDLVVRLQNSSYRPGLLDIIVEGVAENIDE